ncbi:CBU_0592 family membrane protein [Arcanobacterium buesumense]|uniref:Transporter n=1 Tax=Arcanobacterium buesumense TaxID=2722751 RepID=A0A6H2EN65_9ACTO|nr:transporter [Arcanobacterium buesumense]QJC22492.1 transporter [Arcanobacterium buesumense]
MPLSTEIGLIAPIALLAAFGLLNAGKLTPDHYAYQWMNVIGAAALTYTVIDPFNPGVFVTEVLWTLIGVYGVVKIYRARRKEANKPTSTHSNG